MKIAEVRCHPLDHGLEEAFESACAKFTRRQHLLVEIICDNGLTGWGECLGPVRANAAVVQTYAETLIGTDPLETEILWQRLYHGIRDQGQRGLAVTALSGVDIALWDIKGRHFGVPVSTLLGGRVHDQITAYATGGFRRDTGDRPIYMAEECAGYVAEGFSAIKIKIGFDVAEDAAVIRAVRAAIGPDIALMVDANHGYDVPEAIALGRAVADQDIGWFEEPVLPEQIDAYCAVRAGQPIPVAGGETWHSRYAFRTPLARRAVDILQPDLCAVGGFTEMRRVADMAALAGVRLVPHVWGTGVQIAAALQAMAAQLPDPPRPGARAPIMEFDRTPNPFRQAVLTQPIEHVGGVVAVPNGPGLGIEINRDALREFAMTL